MTVRELIEAARMRFIRKRATSSEAMYIAYKKRFDETFSHVFQSTPLTLEIGKMVYEHTLTMLHNMLLKDEELDNTDPENTWLEMNEIAIALREEIMATMPLILPEPNISYLHDV